MCPASDVALYTYRNPGEDINQAVSIAGQPYTELPNAFRYRHEVDRSCSCRRAGQSWADALKNVDDRSTLERGDIVVTPDKARAMSQAPLGKKPDPRAAKTDPKAAATAADPSATSAPAADQPAETDPTKRPVRTVGPTFLPKR
jgi:protein involved in polysaccharide export with SLBB domain